MDNILKWMVISFIAWPILVLTWEYIAIPTLSFDFDFVSDWMVVLSKCIDSALDVFT
jgi:hypothetical protein